MKNQKNLKSQIVISSWGGSSGEPLKVAKCDTFKAVSWQQVVAQLVQIPWGQNFTKNLLDEFRSSLSDIKEIESR